MAMTHILERFIRHVVKSGDLSVTFADGSTSQFGNTLQPHVHICFRTAAAERAVAIDPALKLGECYMEGDLEFLRGDIFQLLELIFQNAQGNELNNTLWLKLVHQARRLGALLLDWNTLSRSRSNVQRHYDLSGELYDLFLDPDRQYSCAYFETPDVDLEQAQLSKKRHIASKLFMDEENLTVLDIGSGWGGMGLHLARQFNSKVTGVTLSDEQFTLSNQRAHEDGFKGQVEFRLQDYRNLDQTFDRIVSVGMFEHVGPKHFGTYFAKCADLLDRDGVMLLHTIGQHLPPSPTNPFIKSTYFQAAISLPSRKS